MDQERVIGTLLGVRSDDGTEVEIRNCFGVGHNESQEQVCAYGGVRGRERDTGRLLIRLAQLQVEVDMEYHKTMLGLHLKANPREVLVGW